MNSPWNSDGIELLMNGRIDIYPTASLMQVDFYSYENQMVLGFI